MNTQQIYPTFLILIMSIMLVIRRIIIKKWTEPGLFLGLIWFSYFFCSLIIVPEYQLKISGMLWIVLNILIFNIGVSLGSKTDLSSFYNPKNKTIAPNAIESYERQLCVICLISACIGILAPWIYLSEKGMRVIDIFNLDNIFEISHEYSFARYTDRSYREPVWGIFFTSFIYIGVLFGGTLFAIKTRPRSVFLSFLGFFPALLVTIILTTRASFLFSAILWISAYLSTKITITAGQYKLFTFKKIIFFSSTALILLLIYVVGQIFREGQDFEDIDSLKPIITSTFLGSPSAFTMWFDEEWDKIDALGWGSRIFGSYYRLFFSIPFTEFDSVRLGDSSSILEETTVHTIFRELIFDFSLPGSLVFFLLFGVTSGLAFTKARQGSILGMNFLGIYYNIALTSATGFPFAYTTIGFAWLVYSIGCYKLFDKNLHEDIKAFGDSRSVSVR